MLHHKPALLGRARLRRGGGQIGVEEDVGECIEKLVTVFREVRRVLRADGTLWLNIGDTYTSGNRETRAPDKKNPAREMLRRPPTPQGLKPKELVGLPWRLALALQADGWYLRCDIIWEKPNCRPESVRDRPTRAHEYIFLLAKSKDYYYNGEAVKEPAAATASSAGFRNRRSVWKINTRPFADAHFATFPEELVRLCLRAGSKVGSHVLDPFCGSGTVGKVCVDERRGFVGIEIKAEYVEMSRRRIFGDSWGAAEP